jgi:hypothetical protein
VAYETPCDEFDRQSGPQPVKPSGDRSEDEHEGNNEDRVDSNIEDNGCAYRSHDRLIRLLVIYIQYY